MRAAGIMKISENQTCSSLGLWEQIRMDHGKEFVLIISVQRILSHLRLDESRASFKQTTSTKNNVAERFWPEVNQRINYPIKRAMNEVLQNDVIERFDLTAQNLPIFFKISCSFQR